MVQAKVAVVTGANKGVGYGIVRRLARQYPTSHFAKLGASPSSSPSSPPPPLHIYLASRDVSRGEAALSELRAELRAERVLSDHGGLTTVEVHQLDVSSADSRRRLFETLRKTDSPGGGGLDMLVNNAGVALEGFDADVVRATLETNYVAVAELTNLLEPLLRGGAEGARVVNVASMLGHLHGFGEAVARRFREASTRQDVDALLEDYVADVARGEWRGKGWKGSAYATSKSALIALTRVTARRWKEQGRHSTITACCPGYVKTDMSKQRGVLTLDEGATTPVKLCLDDLGADISGTFWQREEKVEW